MGTGFGVGEGMMVVFHLETTCRGYGVKLVVGQVRELAARGPKGIKEQVVGVIHLIGAEDNLEAALVKGLVVSDQGQPLNEGFYLCPDVWKDGRIIGFGVNDEYILSTVKELRDTLAYLFTQSGREFATVIVLAA